MRSRSLTAMVLMLMLGGCRRGGPPETPVAKLDDATLTLEQVKAQFDSSRGVSSAQLAEYIQRWINDEMLYREALRRGLDQQESIRQRLNEVRRQLAINALLDEVVYTRQSAESTLEEITRYYQSHSSEFTLSGDVALVSLVLFRDRDAANAFRTTVLQSARWGDALRQALADPRQSADVLAHVDSAYHTQSTLLPPELWRVAAASGRVEPSFPIRTAEGFYVLITWKMGRQGQQADLRYVEQEIRGRLSIERRQRLLTELLENLRAKHAVEILVSTTDTASQRSVQ